jgi:hypothetical protein
MSVPGVEPPTDLRREGDWPETKATCVSLALLRLHYFCFFSIFSICIESPSCTLDDTS